MTRGRPKGSGKRWTEFADYTLWAKITVICESEGLDVRRACNALAYRGYWQAREGKYWISNPAKAAEDSRLRPLMNRLEPGDRRNNDPAETFRARYYAAERRKKVDDDFCSECEFWLDVYRRARDNGGDMWAAFSEAEPIKK